jgi:hypothetical protein
MQFTIMVSDWTETQETHLLIHVHLAFDCVYHTDCPCFILPAALVDCFWGNPQLRSKFNITE